MKHIVYAEQDKYPVAILIKTSSMNPQSILQYYVNPLVEKGIKKEDIIIFNLKYPTDKVSAKEAREWLDTLSPALENLGVKTIYIPDGTYFKYLTGVKKIDPYYGYSLAGVHPGYENKKIILGIPYSSLFYNPALQDKLTRSIKTVAQEINGSYIAPGNDIIANAQYPKTHAEIALILSHLATYPILACDIETFSLKPHSAGLGTIAFAWAKDSGVAFPVDCYESDPIFQENKSVNTGRIHNATVRQMLKTFFLNYKGTLIYHGATFDAKILAYALFMSDSMDYENQIKAVDLLTQNCHCTKILAYLSTNNCIQNKLSLKEVAQEYCGNWAQDEIDDIRRIPLPDLLQYNLIDALGTFYAFEKYMPIVEQDNQLDIYNNLFNPLIQVLINAELNGMPMHPEKIHANFLELQGKLEFHISNIEYSALIHHFNTILQTAEWLKKNLEWKKKTEPLEFFNYIKFNPASNPQVQHLLYQEWGLPVLGKTESGAPATDGETLEGLLSYISRTYIIAIDEYENVTTAGVIPTDPKELWIERAKVISSLLQLNKVSKITGTFFKAFQAAEIRKDGFAYLQGNFNATGTKSGRLSSSDPNLQNLPSTGTIYAKTVKECFMAPPGWLMVGADYNSLEDMISALTTKDPNKLKVYTDGYDGHCLRAYGYFGDQMPGIVPESVSSINSIAKAFKQLRQDSKAPTFLLTYGGSWMGLMKNCGFSETEAKAIETKYHELYKVSDEWVAAKIQEATQRGYVEVAFGLRLRTPILALTDLGKSYTPYQAQQEARTAGNALGQSYCMLNNRAAIEFMQRVYASPYKLDIKIICLIHDAIYLMIRDNIDVVSWVNKNLTECMAWQDLPDIQHPTVKIGSALDIFYPSWANSIGIPINASNDEIMEICKKSITK